MGGQFIVYSFSTQFAVGAPLPDGNLFGMAPALRAGRTQLAVWSNNSNASCRLAFVVLEQTTESFSASNGPLFLFCRSHRRRKKQQVVLPLMISFLVIMELVVMQRPFERTLAKQDQLRKAFLFDGPDPTLGVRVKGLDSWAAEAESPRFPLRLAGEKMGSICRPGHAANIFGSRNLLSSIVTLRAICSIHA
jgi:hypothetical protein